MKDDIPPLLEKAHAKNIETHSKENGELDGGIGLSSIGPNLKVKFDEGRECN